MLAPVDIRSTTGKEELLSVSSQEGVIPRRSANVTMFKAESYVGYKLCWPGDLVINSLWAWAYGLGVSQHHGIVSSAYGVYRPSDRVDPRFIHLLMRSVPFQWELQVGSKGIWKSRLQLTDDAFLGAPIPLPRLREQRAIVRYLDHVGRRIRRYVSAKEKLIGLLEEEQQAIINQAVTRGLDPSVRLNPSGVEWLGDVPEHWEVPRIGHFSKVGNGSTPSRQNATYWSGGTHPWLTSSSVNQVTITRADQFVTDSAMRNCHLPKVRAGSVLIGITGQGKTRGMAAILGIEATINQHMAYITPRAVGVSTQYLHVYLTAAYRELRALSESSGSTKAALTCEDIKHFQVALPPKEEQDQLVTIVTGELVATDAATARARRQINLLQEYRTRLIADVVTGKLDVREAAAGLPDEGDDKEVMAEGGFGAGSIDEGLHDAVGLA